MTTDSGFDAQHFLRGLTTQPGVYRMLNADQDVLYVGKARNLRKRVSSYFLRSSGNPRIESMIDQIADIAVTITGSEDEALLLESSLIKTLKPRYNVSLRDDKSYPYIRLSAHGYPRLMFHRGARNPKERYFGPFPSAATVRDAIQDLQRVFLLRNCTDSDFASRSRPCLQHQIQRCSAPCVGKISAEDYAASVQGASDVLAGKAEQHLDELKRQMDAAAINLDFETAALSRDRIAAIRRMQEQRVVTGINGDLDVVVLAIEGGIVGVGIMSVRAGQHRGQVQHYPRVPQGMGESELMNEFLAQHYTSHEPPTELIVAPAPDDADWLAHALTSSNGRSVQIKSNVRGVRRQLATITRQSLMEALQHRLLSRQGVGVRMSALQERFELEQEPERIECFDISHTQGEATVASCVVFDHEGSNKSQYRRFSITGLTPGDDYAAIAQAVRRRFTRVKAGESPLPDVLLIDGGKGQLAAALQELEALEVQVPLVLGVAKGVTRKAGLEQLFVAGKDQALRLAENDPALHLIQQVRDEAHRFAITGHRARRGKTRTASELDEISGLGPARRQSLLRRFGGLQQLRRASLEDLQKVPGIHRALATRVYHHLHENDA